MRGGKKTWKRTDWLGSEQASDVIQLASKILHHTMCTLSIRPSLLDRRDSLVLVILLAKAIVSEVWQSVVAAVGMSATVLGGPPEPGRGLDP